MYQAKNLPFEKGSLEGISQNTIEIHYEKLYKGYVMKYNEIGEKINEADLSASNQVYSVYRGLKEGESFSLDAIILHEFYFDNLGGSGDAADLNVVGALERQFGSFEKFKDIMTAAGMAARGWAVAAVGPHDDLIHVYTCDTHNQGGIWAANPVLVLDVYEHAYFADYGSDRKSYIEAFWKNVNWDVVNKRFLEIK